ncbi:unnamed protein product, partial [marine sediment metagenome]
CTVYLRVGVDRDGDDEAILNWQPAEDVGYFLVEFLWSFL